MLTKRQQQILDFLRDALDRTRIMPTTREIQQHFGFASQTAAVNHLRALERKGAIQRLAGKARGLALASMLERDTMLDVPILGAIAAGMASPAEQVVDGYVSIDAASAGLRRDSRGSFHVVHDRVFALRVRGDSMIEAHILDGDTVILEVREPKNGDVVAALIDGETTLKRYVIGKGGHPFLKAENPLFPDLIPAAELLVQGVMITLVRQMNSPRHRA
jgi:repressor LexA